MQQVKTASLICNQSTFLTPPASSIHFNITLLSKSTPSKIFVHIKFSIKKICKR
jgi:hypothetical protein